jgi:hypothetical protein
MADLTTADAPHQAIMTVGGVFKATIPDESDEERRELER